MKLYHVVAMAKNRVIGKDNKLPWHFSSDMKHFKQLTTGSTVIMGRKTFESIGKPLPGRENIVLSTTPRKNSPDLQFAASLEEALKNVRTFQAYIIGGENLYRQTMDKVDGIYLTNIEGDYEGDAFYPEMPSYFKEKSKTLLQENPKIEVIFYANTKKGRP
ncbi:MAG: dihydrofolate reductase [Candidatus Omnitrophica bacterium]|nr:dihydrofolate reductase [Candidatus Omnitrophota bacterium]